MRLLLDENLPKRLKLDFPEHEIFTVRDKKWNGIKNGELLKLLLDNSFNAPFSPSVPEIKILKVVRSPFSPSVPKIKIRRLFQVLAQRDLELRDKKRLTYLPDVQ